MKKKTSTRKKEFEDLEEYEEVSEEEQEEIDSYMDEQMKTHLKEKEKKDKKTKKANEKILEQELEENIEEYEIEDDFVEQKAKKKFPLKQLLLGILILILILGGAALIDIFCVTELDKGPFFAIPVHTYDDGGTKEYLGLGYKVIHYNQLQGRRDRQLGTWSLKYNVDPIYVDVIDLAIEFNNDEKSTYEYYQNQFLVVTGNLKKVDKKKKQITFEFEDEGGKYSLDVICKMEKDSETINILEPKYEISAMGTVEKYESKTKEKPRTLYLKSCFAEQ